MGVAFNANEILGIAERIEQNGAKFYRKAAGATGDDNAKKIMLDLAAMEDEHEKTFAAMQGELSSLEKEDTAFDPQGEAGLYLAAFAGGHVFNVNDDPSEKLTGQESPAEVLQTAIGLEKDSVVFYLGIRDMVPKKLGKDKVEAIISEEMSHITVLGNALDSL